MKSTFLIAFLMGVTGVSLIAEQAVPGDFLYPVKLSINENIKKGIAIGADAEARLALDLLRERIREMEILADQGRLDTTAALDVSARITAQTEAARSAAVAAQTGVIPPSTANSEIYQTLEEIKQALQKYQSSLTPAAASVLQVSVEEASALVSEDNVTDTEEIATDVPTISEISSSTVSTTTQEVSDDTIASTTTEVATSTETATTSQETQ